MIQGAQSAPITAWPFCSPLLSLTALGIFLHDQPSLTGSLTHVCATVKVAESQHPIYELRLVIIEPRTLRECHWSEVH